MRHPTFDFHYSHLLPPKAPMVLTIPLRAVCCVECGAEFETKAPSRKRCDPCRAEHDKRYQARKNEQLQAKRRAARETRKP
jgi:hypothetical protein